MIRILGTNRGLEWQREDESGAAADRALGPDLAAVPGEHALRSGESNGRLIVPGFGDGGAVVYRINDAGKLVLQTVHIWKP